MRKLQHGGDEFLIGLVIALSCFVTVSWIFVYPHQTIKFNKSLNVAKPLGEVPFVIPKRFQEFDGYFDMADIIIREN